MKNLIKTIASFVITAPILLTGAKAIAQEQSTYELSPAVQTLVATAGERQVCISQIDRFGAVAMTEACESVDYRLYSIGKVAQAEGVTIPDYSRPLAMSAYKMAIIQRMIDSATREASAGRFRSANIILNEATMLLERPLPDFTH